MDEKQRQWLAAREAEGLKIDPETAEVITGCGDVGDPYDLIDRQPGEEFNSGRMWFARAPGGEWIDFRDLPETTVAALWRKRAEWLPA
jgi:hypothetical protein